MGGGPSLGAEEEVAVEWIAAAASAAVAPLLPSHGQSQSQPGSNVEGENAMHAMDSGVEASLENIDEEFRVLLEENEFDDEEEFLREYNQLEQQRHACDPTNWEEIECTSTAAAVYAVAPLYNRLLEARQTKQSTSAAAASTVAEVRNWSELSPSLLDELARFKCTSEDDLIKLVKQRLRLEGDLMMLRQSSPGKVRRIADTERRLNDIERVINQLPLGMIARAEAQVGTSDSKHDGSPASAHTPSRGSSPFTLVPSAHSAFTSPPPSPAPSQHVRQQSGAVTPQRRSMASSSSLMPPPPPYGHSRASSAANSGSEGHQQAAVSPLQGSPPETVLAGLQQGLTAAEQELAYVQTLPPCAESRITELSVRLSIFQYRTRLAEIHLGENVEVRASPNTEQELQESQRLLPVCDELARHLQKNGEFETHSKTIAGLRELIQSRNFRKALQEAASLRKVVQPFDVHQFREYVDAHQRATAKIGHCDITLEFGATGAGKCWGKGTEMFLYDGSVKKVEEIVPGDMLMGDDSTPRVVLSTNKGNTARDAAVAEALLGSHVELPATFRVNFTRPEEGCQSWTCNGDHILVLRWNIRPSQVRAASTDVHGGQPVWMYETIQADVEEKTVYFKQHYFNHREDAEAARQQALSSWIPIVWEGTVHEFLKLDSTIQSHAQMFQPRMVQFSAPLVSLTKRIAEVNAQPTDAITQHQLESVARLLGIAMVNGAIDETACDTWLPATLNQVLHGYGLAEQTPTHVPMDLLRECMDVRIALLAGIIQGFGCHYNAKAQAYEWTVSSTKFPHVIDFRRLARSVGYKTAIMREAGRDWIVRLSGPEVHQLATKMKEHGSMDDDGEHHGEGNFEIKRVEHADYYGFQIDGNGRCLLSDFTITHNSTFTHWLAGSRMRKMKVDGILHIAPVEVSNPQLKTVVSAPGATSVTRALAPVTINTADLGATGRQASLLVVDAPGLEDSDGKEIDAANNMALLSLAKASKSIKMLVFISQPDLGGRFLGIKKIALYLAKILGDIEQYLSTLIFVFTKFSADQRSEVPGMIRSVLDAISVNPDQCEGVAEQMQLILGHIQECLARQDPTDMSVLFIDPLAPRSEAIRLIRCLSRTVGIQNPGSCFQAVPLGAMQSIQQQILRFKADIQTALQHNDYALIEYRLRLLRDLRDSIEDGAANTAYGECVQCVSQALHRRLVDHEKLVQQRVDSHTLTAEDGKRIHSEINALERFERISDELKDKGASRAQRLADNVVKAAQGLRQALKNSLNGKPQPHVPINSEGPKAHLVEHAGRALSTLSRLLTAFPPVDDSVLPQPVVSSGSAASEGSSSGSGSGVSVCHELRQCLRGEWSLASKDVCHQVRLGIQKATSSTSKRNVSAFVIALKQLKNIEQHLLNQLGEQGQTMRGEIEKVRAGWVPEMRKSMETVRQILSRDQQLNNDDLVTIKEEVAFTDACSTDISLRTLFSEAELHQCHDTIMGLLVDRCKQLHDAVVKQLAVHGNFNPADNGPSNAAATNVQKSLSAVKPLIDEMSMLHAIHGLSGRSSGAYESMIERVVGAVKGFVTDAERALADLREAADPSQEMFTRLLRPMQALGGVEWVEQLRPGTCSTTLDAIRQELERFLDARIQELKACNVEATPAYNANPGASGSTQGYVHAIALVRKMELMIPLDSELSADLVARRASAIGELSTRFCDELSRLDKTYDVQAVSATSKKQEVDNLTQLLENLRQNTKALVYLRKHDVPCVEEFVARMQQRQQELANYGTHASKRIEELEEQRCQLLDTQVALTKAEAEAKKKQGGARGNLFASVASATTSFLAGLSPDHEDGGNGMSQFKSSKQVERALKQLETSIQKAERQAQAEGSKLKEEVSSLEKQHEEYLTLVEDSTPSEEQLHLLREAGFDSKDQVEARRSELVKEVSQLREAGVEHAMEALDPVTLEAALAFAEETAKQSALPTVRERAIRTLETLKEYGDAHGQLMTDVCRNVLSRLHQPTSSDQLNVLWSRLQELRQCCTESSARECPRVCTLLKPITRFEEVQTDITELYERVRSVVTELHDNGSPLELADHLQLVQRIARLDRYVQSEMGFKQLLSQYTVLASKDKKGKVEDTLKAIQRKDYDTVNLHIVQFQSSECEDGNGGQQVDSYTGIRQCRRPLLQSLLDCASELFITASVLVRVPVSADQAQSLRKELVPFSKWRQLRDFLGADNAQQVDKAEADLSKALTDKLEGSLNSISASIARHHVAEAEHGCSTLKVVIQLVGDYCIPERLAKVQEELEQVPHKLRTAVDERITHVEQAALDLTLMTSTRNLYQSIDEAVKENGEYTDRLHRLGLAITNRFEQYLDEVKDKAYDGKGSLLRTAEGLQKAAPAALQPQLQESLNRARDELQYAAQEAQEELQHAFNSESLEELAAVYRKFSREGNPKELSRKARDHIERRAQAIRATINKSGITAESDPAAVRAALYREVATLCEMRRLLNDIRLVKQACDDAEQMFHVVCSNICENIGFVLSTHPCPTLMDAGRDVTAVQRRFELFAEFEQYFGDRLATGGRATDERDSTLHFGNRWQMSLKTHQALADWLTTIVDATTDVLHQKQPNIATVKSLLEFVRQVEPIVTILFQWYSTDKLPLPNPAELAARMRVCQSNSKSSSGGSSKSSSDDDDDSSSSSNTPCREQESGGNAIDESELRAASDVAPVIKRIKTLIQCRDIKFKDLAYSLREKIGITMERALELSKQKEQQVSVTFDSMHKELQSLLAFAKQAETLSDHLPQAAGAFGECVKAVCGNLTFFHDSALGTFSKPTFHRPDYADLNVAYDYAQSVSDNLSLRSDELRKGTDACLRDILHGCMQAMQKVEKSFRDMREEDAVQAAAHLCRIKEMANMLPWFQKQANAVIDDLLARYQKRFSPANPTAMNVLGVQLQLDHIGNTIVDEHAMFRSIKVSNFNQATQGHDLNYVLDYFKHPKGSDNKPQKVDEGSLVHAYTTCHSTWKEEVQELLVNGQKELLVRRIQDAAKQCGAERRLATLVNRNRPSNSGGVSLPARGALRSWLDNKARSAASQLLGMLFALWSYHCSDHFKGKVVTKELVQPHAPQVVTVLRLLGIGIDSQRELQDHLIEIGTGEGKSVTLAMVAAILALFGMDVSCVCYSEYLSRRDYQDFSWLFDLLGLRNKIFYGTFNEVCERLISSDGDIRSKVESMFALATDGSSSSSSVPSSSASSPSSSSSSSSFASSSSSAVAHALLIDEADTLFSEELYGQCYRPVARLRHPTIDALVDDIWAQRTNRNVLRIDEFQKRPAYQDCQAVFTRTGDEDMLREAVKDMVVAVRDFHYDYVVVDDKIAVQEQDGLAFNVTYGYKTMFAYYSERDKGNITPSSCAQQVCVRLSCGSFSYAEMPHCFDLIVGVTGTLKTLALPEREIIEKDYSIKRFTYMPSTFGQNKVRFSKNSKEDVQICNNDDYFPNLAREINNRIASVRGGGSTDSTGRADRSRAVIVFFETDARLQAFHNHPAFLSLQECSGILTEAMASRPGVKESFVKDATQSGRVSLLTRSFGRGTDFKVSNPTVKVAGGVHVIQTFLSLTDSEETQIRGRTARQANEGSYGLFLLDAELEQFGITADMIQTARDAGHFYDMLKQHRNQAFIRKYEARKDDVASAHAEHVHSQRFLRQLRACDRINVKRFLAHRNVGASMVKSRTLVLIDATYSMDTLLEKAKTTVFQTFTRAAEILKQNRLDPTSFEIMIAVYRNYNVSWPLVLQSCGWESDPSNLRTFLDTISVDGGWGNEAIELGFAHAKNEIERAIQMNAPRVSQVVLIGDAPPNTRDDVTTKRTSRRNDLAPAAYQQPTYWEDELAAITSHHVPVHTFYLQQRCKQAFEEIAARSNGESHPLDVNQSKSEELTNLLTTQVLQSYDGVGMQMAEEYRQKYAAKSYV